MPVHKFRSVADMPGLKKRTPLDPDNLRLACELTQLAYWLHPMKHVPGVRKYRSLEEAWEAQGMGAEPASPACRSAGRIAARSPDLTVEKSTLCRFPLNTQLLPRSLQIA